MKNCLCDCARRHPDRPGICNGRDEEKVKLFETLDLDMCGPCAVAFIHAREEGKC